MRIAFLTTGDPLYLPKFFERVLSSVQADAYVYSVPPLYANQSTLQALVRFYRTFGLGPCLSFSWRLGTTRLKRRSIKSVCEEQGVEFEVIEDVNASEFVEKLRGLSLDVVVSVSCPQIFKPALLAVSKHGILNIHGALLPNYRGVLPAFWMLAAGEKVAGVSIHFVNEKIDAGDLCGQTTFPIRSRESLHEFLMRSKEAAAELLLEVLQQLRGGLIERRPLNLAEGSFYSWPTAEDYRRFRLAGRRLF